MKKYILSEYIEENRAEFTKTHLRMNKGKMPLRRKRSPEEQAVLLELDRARWDQWLADGRIEITGERKFRLHIL